MVTQEKHWVPFVEDTGWIAPTIILFSIIKENIKQLREAWNNKIIVF